MDPELFNRISKGELPVLAVTLLGARHPSGDFHPASSDVAMSRRFKGVDPLLAQAQWVALLAHLSQTASRCAQPDIADQLKTLGVRRSQTVVTSLAREYVRAWDLAVSIGFVHSPHDVLQVTHTMLQHDHLTEDFRALADTYRLLLWVMAPRNGGQLSRWLSDRASVHAAQAQAIQ
jgi:hypothetical protein